MSAVLICFSFSCSELLDWLLPTIFTTSPLSGLLWLYLRARAADFREVERTVLARLIDDKGGTGLPDQAFTEPTILICEELTPTLSEQLRRLSIAGVIQLGGGTTSHGAILARALGIPAIGGARKDAERLRPAQQVAINGSEGVLWIDPSPDVLRDLVGRQQLELFENQTAFEKSHEPAITKDGISIQVGGNAGSAKDIFDARANGAEFIGLFRSEFLFQDFTEEPDEDQQLAAYQKLSRPLEAPSRSPFVCWTSAGINRLNSCRNQRKQIHFSGSAESDC